MVREKKVWKAWGRGIWAGQDVQCFTSFHSPLAVADHVTLTNCKDVGKCSLSLVDEGVDQPNAQPSVSLHPFQDSFSLLCARVPFHPTARCRLECWGGRGGEFMLPQASYHTWSELGYKVYRSLAP